MNQFHSSLDLYHRNKGRRATVPETPFLLLAKRIPPMYWRLFGVLLWIVVWDTQAGGSSTVLGKQSTGQSHQLAILVK